jgi:hypothetical protein
MTARLRRKNGAQMRSMTAKRPSMRYSALVRGVVGADAVGIAASERLLWVMCEAMGKTP